MAIHPSAIIDSKAEIHSSVEVGPYAVIDAQVVLGPVLGGAPCPSDRRPDGRSELPVSRGFGDG